MGTYINFANRSYSDATAFGTQLDNAYLKATGQTNSTNLDAATTTQKAIAPRTDNQQSINFSDPVKSDAAIALQEKHTQRKILIVAGIGVGIIAAMMLLKR